MRLIDADELMKLYENTSDFDIDTFKVPIPVIRQNILDMPTVNSVDTKDMYVCFRHQKADGQVWYSCIQSGKLYDNMPGDNSDIVYFDMDDDTIEKMIDMLNRIKT